MAKKKSTETTTPVNDVSPLDPVADFFTPGGTDGETEVNTSTGETTAPPVGEIEVIANLTAPEGTIGLFQDGKIVGAIVNADTANETVTNDPEILKAAEVQNPSTLAAEVLTPDVLSDVKEALTADGPSPADVEAHAAALKNFDEGAALAAEQELIAAAAATSSVDVVNIDTGAKVSLTPEDADKLRADLFGPPAGEAQPEGTHGDGAHATGNVIGTMIGPDEFARSLDVEAPTEPSTISRVQSWNPTHRIRTADSVTPLMLTESGEAFSFEEWIDSKPYAQVARVSVDSEGRESWERDGAPVEGVTKIES